MKQANTNYKNSGNDENDLFNMFRCNMDCLNEPNLGSNCFSMYAEEFHEKDIPLAIGERTRLMLSHPNHEMSQISKGFIFMEVEFEVGFEDYFNWENFQEITQSQVDTKYKYENEQENKKSTTDIYAWVPKEYTLVSPISYKDDPVETTIKEGATFCIAGECITIIF